MSFTHRPPRPHFPERVPHGWSDLREAALNAGLTADDVAALETGPHKPLLDGLFGNSPFLTRLILREPAFVKSYSLLGPDPVLEQEIESLKRIVPGLASVDEVMAALRQAKRRMALGVAMADISGDWALEQVTAMLSRFAETALDLAVAHLLRAAMIKGELAPPDGWGDPATRPATPEIATDSGYFVLGMGKLGGRELNYSSDIDLIVFFDGEVMRYTGKRSPQDCFVKITRDLVRIMQELTGDGYVFRTDLRLRPDPGATPVAISVEAAEIYYQSMGLNWERAAMIKARPVAGDRAAGHDFLDRIKSFVWRKHLDFVAVQDIHAIKGQIHRHHGHRGITVSGQDVKLGRGGIREIEFFAQIHQLISGGRERALQVPPTLPALAALRDLGKIDTAVHAELVAAYRFLRQVEHRLQMIHDEQTHAVPSTEDGVAHLATFLGFNSADDFGTELLGHLHAVKRHYDELLEPDQGEAGTGSSDESAVTVNFDAADPELINLLRVSGFKDLDRLAAIVEGWGFGRYRALRTPRSRALLKQIAPRLIAAFGEMTDPDAALTKFDEFLAKLPSGVQILSLFHANPWLLDLMAKIMGIAPALAATLARRPQLLDAVLTPSLFESGNGRSLDDALKDAIANARDYQDVLDISRIWGNEQRFRIGVQLLEGALKAEQAGQHLSDIAEAILRVMLDEAAREFSRKHGRIAGGAMVVVGMGKLGGRELTFTSDLDLVFVFEAPPDAQSDGSKSLTAGHYFTRLSQVYINALTALTAEGLLYEIDMRLRPSGNAGPLAVSLETFAGYQHETAWTWEHMALTRARPIAGDPDLMAKVKAAIRDVLTARREPDKLLADVADMRQRLRAEFGTNNIWSVKHCPGGIVDVEFIWQYLMLRHGADDPSLITQNAREALQRLQGRGYLGADDGTALLRAFSLLNEVQGLLRLCTDKTFSEQDAPRGLTATLASATGNPDFATLRAQLVQAQTAVSEIYRRLIAEPAAALNQNKESSHA